MATPKSSKSSKSSSKGSGKSQSAKAGLIFPVGRIGSMLRKGRYTKRVAAAAPVLVNVSAGAGADSNAAKASDEIQRALQALPGAQRVEEVALPKGEAGQTDIAVFRIYGENVPALIPKTIHMVAESNAELCDLHINHPSLEDVFIHLTGRNLRA